MSLESSGTNEDKVKNSKKDDLRAQEYDSIFPYNFEYITPKSSSMFHMKNNLLKVLLLQEFTYVMSCHCVTIFISQPPWNLKKHMSL